jgi:hypothetical protein
MPKIEPIRDPPKRFSDAQLPPSLTRMVENALVVDPGEVERHIPTEAEVAIAKAYLSGKVKIADLAKTAEVSLEHVRKILGDPVTCAWICGIIHRNVQHRLGMIDAAMLNRAINGDCRAAEILYKRYNQMKNIHVHGHIVAGMDYGKLTDEDLRSLIGAAQKTETIIDVEPTASGHPGASAPGP